MIVRNDVKVVGRKKGSNGKWIEFPFTVSSADEAKEQIRKRSGILDEAFDFAIKTVTIETYSERDSNG